MYHRTLTSLQCSSALRPSNGTNKLRSNSCAHAVLSRQRYQFLPADQWRVCTLSPVIALYSIMHARFANFDCPSLIPIRNRGYYYPIARDVRFSEVIGRSVSQDPRGLAIMSLVIPWEWIQVKSCSISDRCWFSDEFINEWKLIIADHRAFIHRFSIFSNTKFSLTVICIYITSVIAQWEAKAAGGHCQNH